jgi:hypothetical protein
MKNHITLRLPGQAGVALLAMEGRFDNNLPDYCSSLYSFQIILWLAATLPPPPPRASGTPPVPEEKCPCGKVCCGSDETFCH